MGIEEDTKENDLAKAKILARGTEVKLWSSLPITPGRSNHRNECVKQQMELPKLWGKKNKQTNIVGVQISFSHND